MRHVCTFLLLVCCASAAHAQSTFVSGAFVGEVARFGRLEGLSRLDSEFDTSFDGESIGFSVAVERLLGERWGVMLEFTRPGEIERESTYSPPVIAIFPPVPSFEVTRELEYRHDSLNAMATFSQPAGDRVELGFMGGVTFTHAEWRQTYRITPPDILRFVPSSLSLVAPTTSATDFGVGPIIGFEARIGITDRLAVVPGVRLQSARVAGQSGWLFRPAVGARFGF